MIKQLIEDVTFERITLKQALTRAKIIAYKIKNDDFKDWLVGEINGGYKGRELPKYRIIPCDIYAEVFVPFQGTKTVPLDVTSVEDWAGKYSFNEQRVTQSIATLELGLSQSGENQFGYDYFPMDLTNQFKKLISEGDSITAIKRRIQLSQIEHILEQTKQILLDTLLELNEKFPDLENDFNDSNTNNEKVQNIINQYIYGNNSNSNIGIGEKITQKNSQISYQIDKEKLKSFGLKENQIEELEIIVQEVNRESRSSKIMQWIGKVSESVVASGVTNGLPKLIEYLQEFVNQ